jgi:hypothetical protein
LASLPAVASDFYVSPAGSKTGDGSITNPWDLVTAFAAPTAVKPGDTVWLRGGTYGTGGSTVFYSMLTGTASQPIIVRQYAGERASVNGGIQVFGPYSWFWDFEILNTYPVRVSNYSGSFPPDIPQTTGILPVSSGQYPTVQGVKFINLITHDTANGLSSFSASPGTEIYGCLTYNNGWIGTDRGHGHGIYLQNTGATDLISDNLIFNNFDAGLHPSGSSNASIANITMQGNAVFFNGQSGGHLVNNVVVEGGSYPPKSGIVLDSNYIYNPVEQVGNAGYNQVGGQGDATNGDLVMTNNVWVGGDPDLLMSSWIKMQFTNNILYAQTNSSTNYQGQVNLQLLAGQNLSQYTWDNNTYYPVGWRLFMLFYNGTNTYGGGLSGWQSYTGLDAHSVAPANLPSGVWSYVRPNKYEPGRAHVILYNWDLRSSVSVDISGAGLSVGQQFEIRDAENFFGNPVVTGTYNGSPVSIPMTGLTIAQPIGDPVKIVHTAPQFGAFVILPVGVQSVHVAVSPASVTLTANQTQQFTATVTGSQNTQVTWSLSPNTGTVSNTGLYQAPANITSTQVITLTATSVADPSKSASASITLAPSQGPSISITSPANGATVSGSVTVAATVTQGSSPITGVQFSLDGANLGAQVTSPPYQVTWDTTKAANGSHTLTATVTDNSGNHVTSSAVAVTVSNGGAFTPIRINAGGPYYVDHVGQPWSADTGYAGGASWISGGIVNNTSDPTLYLSERYGTFSYQFAVPNGTYTTRLKFAELYYTKAGQRVFNVSINGQQVLTNFDIVAAAGAAVTAIDEAFPITVTNGQIAIQFSQVVNSPVVNAIEITGVTNGPSVQITSPVSGATVSGSITVAASVTQGSAPITGVQFTLDGANLGAPVTSPPYQVTWDTTKVANGSHTLAATVSDSSGNHATSNPITVTVNNTGQFTPIRINTGGPSYVDHLGQKWSADTGFTGGTGWISGGVINNTLDPTLYLSERYGTFTYQFTVPNGTYTTRLKFAELFYTGPGQRVFNVSINGQPVLTNFDIVGAAGAAVTAIDEAFPITVTGGQISIQFSQVTNSPVVNAIEITQ